MIAEGAEFGEIEKKKKVGKKEEGGEYGQRTRGVMGGRGEKWSEEKDGFQKGGEDESKCAFVHTHTHTHTLPAICKCSQVTHK